MRFSSGLRLLAFAATVIGCAKGTDCIAYPCAPPAAVELTVSDASTGGAVPGTTVNVTGAITGTVPCNQNAVSTVCFIGGGPGTYDLSVSAPGYSTATKSVQVPGTPASSCGCATTQVQHVSLALTKA